MTKTARRLFNKRSAGLFHLSRVLNQAQYSTIKLQLLHPAHQQHVNILLRRKKNKPWPVYVSIQPADSSKKSDANPLTEILKNPTKVVLLRVCVCVFVCVLKGRFPDWISITERHEQWAWLLALWQFCKIVFEVPVVTSDFTVFYCPMQEGLMSALVL